MSILSGYGKFKRYVLTNSGYKLCSQWTSSNTVHFDDGNTAQTKVGAINGITDSLTATNSNIALSAAAGKNLQDQVTQLNTGLAGIEVDQLWTGAGFISGSITPDKSPLSYDFLVFSNNFRGSTVVKTAWGTMQAAIIFNANAGTYTDVFTFSVDNQNIEIVRKRRTVTAVDNVFFVDESAEPITAIYGIKL